MNTDELIDEWVRSWGQEWVGRKEISRFTKGFVSNRQCQADDCAGKGPKVRVKVVGIVRYPVAAVAEWLRRRIKVCEGAGDR